MSPALIVLDAGPGLTVQDRGRPGHLAQGLSRGGAVDPVALDEGAALLGQAPDLAALEMAGMGGLFEATGPLRIALTGAQMDAGIEGRPVRWQAVHRLGAGDRLRISAVRRGNYGYLHLAGGIAAPLILGSRSAHLAAGLGKAIGPGDRLEAGHDSHPGAADCALPEAVRFEGGEIRVLPGAQTHLFDPAERARFAETPFRRGLRGNRQGVMLEFTGDQFATVGHRALLSEIVVPGDIQMTGDGHPFVLLCECQTMGGYPRIGTVLPDDLPRIAQAGPGMPLRFRFVDRDEALAAHQTTEARLARLRAAVAPLRRDPRDIADLLSYQLIGGVVSGKEG